MCLGTRVQAPKHAHTRARPPRRVRLCLPQRLSFCQRAPNEADAPSPCLLLLRLQGWRFTVLAPSNAAMERAIEASGMTRRQLFNDPDFQELVKLHVIYGEYSVEKLRAEHGRDLPTLKLYNEVTVGSKAPGLPTINTVQLVEGRVDIEADNGVVHVIDELLAQAPTATLLVESTAGRERLNSVRRMWRDADVDGLFSRNEYRFTFFLPEDSLFLADLARRGQTLAEFLAKGDLRMVALYGVACGAWSSYDLYAGQELGTLQGTKADITSDDEGNLYYAGQRIIDPDIPVNNGWIHIVENVPRYADIALDDITTELVERKFYLFAQGVAQLKLWGQFTKTLEELWSERRYTVLVPTDTAMRSFIEEADMSVLQFMESPDLRAYILKHFIGERVSYDQLRSGRQLQSLQGDKVECYRDPTGRVYVDGHLVGYVDGDFVNGRVDFQASEMESLLHAIDGVLSPIDRGYTVLQALRDNGFNTAVRVFLSAGLWDKLTHPASGVTLFAPTDEAFAAAIAAAGGESAFFTSTDLATVAKYHVSPQTVQSSGLSNGLQLPTLLGGRLTISQAAGGFLVDGAAIGPVVDKTADNGVVHGVQSVLSPPDSAGNMVEYLQDNGFTALAAALVSTGVAGQLMDGSRKFSIFAPTNEAMATAGADSLSAEALTNLLLYHVVEGEVYDDDLVNHAEFTGLQGGAILVRVIEHVDIEWDSFSEMPEFRRGTRTLNRWARLVDASDKAQARNGVIHTIDKVLVPPPPLGDVSVDGLESVASPAGRAAVCPAAGALALAAVAAAAVGGRLAW